MISKYSANVLLYAYSNLRKELLALMVTSTAKCDAYNAKVDFMDKRD